MDAPAPSRNPPDYHVFIETGDACLLPIGVAWKHKTNDGLNVLLSSGDRYVFYPSKLDKKHSVLMTRCVKGPGLNLVLECSDGRHLYFHTLKTKRVKPAALHVCRREGAAPAVDESTSAELGHPPAPCGEQ